MLASDRPGKSNAVLRLYKSYLTLSTRHGMTSEQFKVAFVVFVLSTLFVPGAKHDHVCVDYWGAHHVFIYVSGQTTTSILNCSHQLASSSRTPSQDADTRNFKNLQINLTQHIDALGLLLHKVHRTAENAYHNRSFF